MSLQIAGSSKSVGLSSQQQAVRPVRAHSTVSAATPSPGSLAASASETGTLPFWGVEQSSSYRAAFRPSEQPSYNTQNILVGCIEHLLCRVQERRVEGQSDPKRGTSWYENGRETVETSK